MCAENVFWQTRKCNGCDGTAFPPTKSLFRILGQETTPSPQLGAPLNCATIDIGSPGLHLQRLIERIEISSTWDFGRQAAVVVIRSA